LEKHFLCTREQLNPDATLFQYQNENYLLFWQNTIKSLSEQKAQQVLSVLILTFDHISNLCLIVLDYKLFPRTRFLALPDTKSSIQQILKTVEKFIPRTNLCFR
jgi:hypothetical protein